MFKAALDKKIQQIDSWLWQTESGTEIKTGKHLLHAARVLFAVIRDLYHGQITLHAMSLVYTTLLAIVPFLALAFSVLKAFGVHRDRLQPLLETWAAALGEDAPEVVDQVMGYIESINFTVLGFLGLGLLIYWVISLVQKVEGSFNEIWQVNKSRSIMQRFSNYLSVIVIGPVLVFSAWGATATVIGSDAFQQLIEFAYLGWLYSLVSRIMPYILIIALFTFLYVFIPNIRVKARYALIGGIVGGALWQTASFGFALFVASSTRYDNIYSGFAVVILTLFWMYVSWLVLLIGAAVSFYAQHAQQITRNRRNLPSAVIDELTGLMIMYRVARQFDNGGGGVSISDMESNLTVGAQTAHRIIEKLIKHYFVTISEDGNHLLPCRSLDKMTLEELIQCLRAPESRLPAPLTQEAAVVELYNNIQSAIDTAAGKTTLAEWVRKYDSPPAGATDDRAAGTPLTGTL